MKKLISITNKDITGDENLSSIMPRIAVGVVLFDEAKNIALSHIGIWDLHGLPGGGVDDGEDYETAAKREVLEETGCNCEILTEIGMTYENWGEQPGERGFVQEKYHYLAKVVGEKGELHLDDYEIASNTTVRWYPLEQAIQIITDRPSENTPEEFFKRRNLAVLHEVSKGAYLC